MLRLLRRRQRQFQGCYYLGCFAPLAFVALAAMIMVKAISDALPWRKR